jgi:hypothetical protein
MRKKLLTSRGTLLMEKSDTALNQLVTVHIIQNILIENKERKTKICTLVDIKVMAVFIDSNKCTILIQRLFSVCH